MDFFGRFRGGTCVPTIYPFPKMVVRGELPIPEPNIEDRTITVKGFENHLVGLPFRILMPPRLYDCTR